VKSCKKTDILNTNSYFLLIVRYSPVFVQWVRTTRCFHMMTNNINLEENEESTGSLLKKLFCSDVVDSFRGVEFRCRV